MAIKWNSHVTNLQVDPATGPSGGVPLCMPNVAATLESSYTSAGQFYYDTTNARIRAYVNGTWATLQTSAGSGVTLDQAYDQGGAGAGRSITADTGAVSITVSNNSNNGALLLTQNDTTNNPVTLTITNAGTGNDITATNWNISKAGRLTCVGLTNTGTTVTAGITDSGTAALSTMTAATGTITTLTATTLNAPTQRAAASGNVNLTMDAAGTGTIGIGTVSTGAITLGTSTTISSGANLTLTNGNITLSAGTVSITAGAGDSDALTIVPIVTQAGIVITPPASYNLASGLIDINCSTGSGSVLDMAFSGAYTGNAVKLNMTNAVGANAIAITGAGTRTAALITVTDVPTTSAPTIDLNLTPGASVQAGIDIDVAGTGGASIITGDYSAADTGVFLDINMTNAVAAKAIKLTGAGTRTTSLVSITDTPGNGGFSIDIASTASNANAKIIRIVEAGTSTNDTIGLSYSAAYAGKALSIVLNNTANSAVGLSITGSQASANAVNVLTSSGIPTAAGRVLEVTSSGNASAANSGACLRVLETGAVQATTYALKVDSTNNEAINVTTGKCHFAESITVLAGASSGAPIFGIRANYISSETGGNNAIAGALTDDAGTNVALTAGLTVMVKLAHTLQAGANTFNLNGGGALSIVSSRNSANNIGTAYAATGYITLTYDGSVWRDMSQ